MNGRGVRSVAVAGCVLVLLGQGCEDGGDDAPAGQFTAYVVSEAAPDGGIAVRGSYPASVDRRYPEGAPIVVEVPGGQGTGEVLPEGQPDPGATAYGYIAVRFVLPGGSSEGISSGGEYDYRGPGCKRALADVLRYVLGLAEDTDGKKITDRVSFALVSNVGVIGLSHGGNLAQTTLADHGSELAGLDWLATWESPIGDQYVAVELGGGPRGRRTSNPYYIPGTCGVTSCPWPGLTSALAFDPDAPFLLEDRATGTVIPSTGILYLDEDGDVVMDTTEFRFNPVVGPGDVAGDPSSPKAYTSTELAAEIESRWTDLFPAGPPPWLASRGDVEAYWAERDGSVAIAEAQAAFPSLLVMALASIEDHVQSQPDHPHVRSQVIGWMETGHPFVRLNPDASYMAAVTGIDASSLPDNEANVDVPYPGVEGMIEPTAVEGTLVTSAHMHAAAILELADRTREGDMSADLRDVLVH